jgi:hypothetical protein
VHRRVRRRRLWYGDYEEFAVQRKGHTVFGNQEVRTRVYHVLPAEADRLDVSVLLDEVRADRGHTYDGPSRQEAWVL